MAKPSCLSAKTQGHTCRLLHTHGLLLTVAMVTLLLITRDASADVGPAFRITRTSVSQGGVQADGQSYCPAISGNGRYVIFGSSPSTVCVGGCISVFDRFTRSTETLTDETPSGGSTVQHPGISTSLDGRFIAYSTDADVYVWDKQAGTAVLVDVSVSSGATNSYGRYPDISGDGRFVTFESYAANLVPHDTNNRNDIFVYDMTSGQIERVSISTSGMQANESSMYPQISDDGRIVSFLSSATNLAPGGTTGSFYVYDRQTNETRWMTDSLGRPHSLSADGRYLAYMLLWGNMDQTVTLRLYRHDVQTGSPDVIHVATSDASEAQEPIYLSLSADGRHVAFASPFSTIAPDDTNGTTDIFVYDVVDQTTEMISQGIGQTPANGPSTCPSISDDGQIIAFLSHADNLVIGDTNATADVFVHDGINYTHAVHLPMVRG